MKTKYAVIAGMLLLLAHTILALFNAYAQMPILDIPMHFLGGVIVTWFFANYFKSQREKISTLAGIVLIIGGVAIVGIFWEFLEWTLDTFVFIKGAFMGGLNDTLFDLAMDLLGGCVIAVIVRKKLGSS